MGVTVDYTTHVGHAVLYSQVNNPLSNQVNNPNERVKEALGSVTKPVLAGGLTTLAGTLPLYWR